MATVKVWSGGTNTSPYDTWAKAATTLLTATAYASADDILHVASVHTETPNANTTYTIANNVSIYSVDKTDDSYLAGATIDNDAGGYDFAFTGIGVSINGVSFYAGDDFSATVNSVITFLDCLFNSTGTSPSVIFYADTYIYFKNGEINFPNIAASSTASVIDFHEGTYILENTTINIPQRIPFETQNGTSADIIFNNCDLSGSTTPEALISNIADASKAFTFNRCKMPPNITSILDSVQVYNSYLKVVINSCTKPDLSGATDDNDAYWYSYTNDWLRGEVEHDNSNYLTATYDGTSGFSVTLSSSANAKTGNPLRHKLVEIPAQDLTSATTYRVNLLTDNVILTDSECWIEIVYPDNTDEALGKTQSSRNTDILAAGTNLLEDTTNTWTSPSVTTDEERYISETLPVLLAVDNGTVEIWMCLAKASTDVWVDPAVVIT